MTQQPHRERYSTPHSTPQRFFRRCSTNFVFQLYFYNFSFASRGSRSTATELTMGRAVEVGVKPEVLNQAASLIEEAVAEDKIPGSNDSGSQERKNHSSSSVWASQFTTHPSDAGGFLVSHGLEQ